MLSCIQRPCGSNHTISFWVLSPILIILPTYCVYLFYIFLRTNSDYVSKQHVLVYVSLYNGSAGSYVRERTWILKYNWNNLSTGCLNHSFSKARHFNLKTFVTSWFPVCIQQSQFLSLMSLIYFCMQHLLQHSKSVPQSIFVGFAYFLELTTNNNRFFFMKKIRFVFCTVKSEHQIMCYQHYIKYNFQGNN